MSKKTQYQCNLCHEWTTNKEAEKALKAYYWKSNILPQGYILSDNLDSSGTHVCDKCVKVIKCAV